MTSFTDMLAAGYGFTEPAITLGAALEGGTVHQEPKVRVPIAMMNRHGLVAGATGTGKTRTLQLLTEQLSAQGVPVFVADIKGDLSGLAVPGQANDRVTGRANDIGWSWTAAGVPVEFVSLTGALGVQLRATVSSFGPLLLGKALSLNETQTSVLTLVFKYCRRQPAPAARPPRSPRRAPVPARPTRGSRAGELRRHVQARRSACCSGRWWSSRRRAPSASSASRSST